VCLLRKRDKLLAVALLALLWTGGVRASFYATPALFLGLRIWAQLSIFFSSFRLRPCKDSAQNHFAIPFRLLFLAHKAQLKCHNKRVEIQLFFFVPRGLTAPFLIGKKLVVRPRRRSRILLFSFFDPRGLHPFESFPIPSLTVFNSVSPDPLRNSPRPILTLTVSPPSPFLRTFAPKSDAARFYFSPAPFPHFPGTCTLLGSGQNNKPLFSTAPTGNFSYPTLFSWLVSGSTSELSMWDQAQLKMGDLSLSHPPSFCVPWPALLTRVWYTNCARSVAYPPWLTAYRKRCNSLLLGG